MANIAALGVLTAGVCSTQLQRSIGSNTKALRPPQVTLLAFHEGIA